MTSLKKNNKEILLNFKGDKTKGLVIICKAVFTLTMSGFFE